MRVSTVSQSLIFQKNKGYCKDNAVLDIARSVSMIFCPVAERKILFHALIIASIFRGTVLFSNALRFADPPITNLNIVLLLLLSI